MGESYPSWDSVDVFVLCKRDKEQDSEDLEETTEGSEDNLLPPELRGPFNAYDMQALQNLSTIDSKHFAYVLSKLDSR